MSDAPVAAEAAATAKAEGKKVATALCKVLVKSLDVGFAVLGRGATLRLAQEDAKKLEKEKKVSIVVELDSKKK